MELDQLEIFTLSACITKRSLCYSHVCWLSWWVVSMINLTLCVKYGDHGSGQKLQLIIRNDNQGIIGILLSWDEIFDFGNLLLVAVIWWYFVFVISSPLSGLFYNYLSFKNWKCIVFFKLWFLVCTYSLTNPRNANFARNFKNIGHEN